MDTVTEPPGTDPDMTPAELADAVADELTHIADPKARYQAARAAEPLLKATLARVARAAVNEMWDAGLREAEIGAQLGVTRQRVGQLIDPERSARARAVRLESREANLKQQMAKVRAAKKRVTKAAS